MKKIIFSIINILIISIILDCSDYKIIGDVKTIYTNESGVCSPKWTPGGNRILFSDGHSLFFIDSDGKNLAKIPMTWSPTSVGYCSISHDGKYIVFSSGYNDNNIYIIPSEGGEPVKLTEAKENEGYSSPDWSYNDEWIYFIKSYGYEDYYEEHLCRIRPDGTDFNYIDFFDMNLFNNIKCSNDGKYILLQYWNDNIKRDKILIGAIDNSTKWDVIKDSYFSSSEDYPCYSSDNKWVCFSDGYELFIVSSDGNGHPYKITEHKNKPNYLDISPDWSPDGQYIVFMTTNYALNIVKVPDEFLPN